MSAHLERSHLLRVTWYLIPGQFLRSAKIFSGAMELSLHFGDDTNKWISLMLSDQNSNLLV